MIGGISGGLFRATLVKEFSLYTPLWCKSNFSYLEGASHPEELIEKAKAFGIESIAITDRDGIYGIVKAHAKAREVDVHLIVGAQISIVDGTVIVLLVENRLGYANLCELITKGRRRSPKGESQVTWEEVGSYARGLIALWGGESSLLNRDDVAKSIVGNIQDAFGDRLYAMVPRHYQQQEKRIEYRIRSHAEHYGLPVIAATEVLYHHPSRRMLQDVLTCIRYGVTLSTVGRLIRANGEHNLKSPEQMRKIYEDDLQALSRSAELASRCHFSLSELRYRYPSDRLPDGSTSIQWLRCLTLEGARNRYRDRIPKTVREQVEKELYLIEELDYCGYFLTMHEIVSFCRKQDILCQGRGSAANSAVCFCLGITNVDPTQINLLFERFLSRERSEPPDIDLDIEHERREEVIQHMYRKYGRTHAAMVANIIRYRPKSAMRDVGKVFGLSDATLERTSKLLARRSSVVCEVLEQAGVDANTKVFKQLVACANEILDFPRHVGIHPGGFLLGHEPVHTIVPIENATMEGRTVIQWDKDDLEQLGLFKVDLLGLGALSQLHRCFDLLARHYNRVLSMDAIPIDDADTYDMICRAETVGVFQIESRAQMSMLPRLRPRCFYDLVIEISLVRPGPITGGMVHPYLRRRHGEESIEFPHPCLRPVLEKTLGVPLFQEQVMQLAVVAADYTPGEADQLRRDMAAWRRTGRIDKHRQRLIPRMQEKGISLQFAERVFDQIRGFGEYGFPESHAASFALIAYATSWIRCHYPAVFYCALLNSQPMGFYSPATIVHDAKRVGIQVLPIDVCRSHWDASLERKGQEYAVRIGLRYVKGVCVSKYQKIQAARRDKLFISVRDFAARSGLDKKTQTTLAEAGALGCLGTIRRNALWQVLGSLCSREDTLRVFNEDSIRLNKLTASEIVLWDYQTSGHSVHGHPLESLRTQLRSFGFPDASMINRMRHGAQVEYLGIVICRQRPGTASGVTFMTLEDETGFVNVVIWKHVFDRYEVLAKTASFLGITGSLQVQEGVVHLIARKLWTPSGKTERPQARSRDFH